MLSNDKERQAQFKEWLQRTKTYSPKAAADANGRAKRAEQILGESLDEIAARDLTAPQVLALLDSRLVQCPDSIGRTDSVANDVRLAVRRYLEFRRSS
jgi:hypothetical protein